MQRSEFARCTIALCLACIVPALRAQPVPDERALAIVRKLDELYRSSSSECEIAMDITTPHWQRTLQMRVWTVGLDKTFIRILAPKKERGMGTLRIGQQMWNYLPRANKTIKIPPSMMMGSWMGSDFTNDDLVKEYTFADDYVFRLLESAEAPKGMLQLECTPKADRAIIWSRVVVTLREHDLLPVRQDFHDEKNRVMRVMEFSDIRDLGGRMLPATLTVIPQNKKGHRTIIRYLDIQFDQDMAEDIFSLRHLRKPL